MQGPSTAGRTSNAFRCSARIRTCIANTRTRLRFRLQKEARIFTVYSSGLESYELASLRNSQTGFSLSSCSGVEPFVAAMRGSHFDGAGDFDPNLLVNVGFLSSSCSLTGDYVKATPVLYHAESPVCLYSESAAQPNRREPLSRLERNLDGKVCWHHARSCRYSIDTGAYRLGGRHHRRGNDPQPVHTRPLSVRSRQGKNSEHT